MSLPGLPSEVLLNITPRLSNASLASLSLACRALNALANSELWSTLLFEDSENHPVFFDARLAVDLPFCPIFSLSAEEQRLVDPYNQSFRFWSAASSGYIRDETWARVRTLVLGTDILWHGLRVFVSADSEEMVPRSEAIGRYPSVRTAFRCTDGQFPTTLAEIFGQGKLSGLREVRLRYGRGPASHDKVKAAKTANAVASLSRSIGSFIAASPQHICLKVDTHHVSHLTDLFATFPTAIMSLRALKLTGLRLSTDDRATVIVLLARAVRLESLWYEREYLPIWERDGEMDPEEEVLWDPLSNLLGKMGELRTLRWNGWLPPENEMWAASLRVSRLIVTVYSEGEWEHLAAQPLAGVESLHFWGISPHLPVSSIAFHDLRSLCVGDTCRPENQAPPISIPAIIAANPRLEHLHISVLSAATQEVLRFLAARENSPLKSLSIFRGEYDDFMSDLETLASASPELVFLRFSLGGNMRLTATSVQTLVIRCQNLEAVVVDKFCSESRQNLVSADIEKWFHTLGPKHKLQTSRGPVEGYDSSLNAMDSFFVDIVGFRKRPPIV